MSKVISYRVFLCLKKGPLETAWIKLDKNYFGLHQDIHLCLCYIMPVNSSAQVRIECEVIDSIILDIAKLDETHPNYLFLVCGDMSGRTGTLADFVEFSFLCPSQASVLTGLLY